MAAVESSPDSPMRILFMADVPPNPYSGAAGTEWQTVEALRQLGHDVDTVWAGDLPHRIRHGNTHYLLELPKAYRDAVQRRLKQRDYDVIHVNQPHGYLAARALHRSRHRAVFVHRSHGFEPRVAHELARWRALHDADARSGWRKALSAAYQALLERHNRQIARHADGHIVSAGQCRDFLTVRYAVKPERIAVIPQAAPDSFRTTPTPPLTRERLAKLLYVGQFAFVKAPMIVAAAVEQVLSRVPGARMTWVCDARHHADVRALFTQRTVLDRVTLRDWLPQSELMHLYDEHGLFIFPSFFEGFGKAPVEAMSRGMAVVASATGGMLDTITTGVDGVLIPVGDADATAQAALALLSQPEAAARLAAAARNHACQLTWERTARECAAFYERLCAPAMRAH